MFLKVGVNEPDLSKLKFEWFKMNKLKATRQEEAIKLEDNPTAHSQVLVIKRPTARDVSDYKCQVTRASTDEKVLSSSCHLKLAKRPECSDLFGCQDFWFKTNLSIFHFLIY